MITRRRSQQALHVLALPVVVLASLIATPGPEGLLGAFLGLLMLAVAVTDYQHYIIPNQLVAAAFAVALIRALIGGPEAGWSALGETILGAAGIALPFLGLMAAYRYWRGRDGLGLGDVKLAGVAGAWLELTTAIGVIELAALSAIAAYVVNAALGRRPLRATAFLPFGVFLAPAIWIGWLVQTCLAG